MGYAIRHIHMASKEAKQRRKILNFWKECGLAATIEAFDVSRRSLLRWQKQSADGKRKMEALNPRSKKPRAFRKKGWHPLIKEGVKRLRGAHPNLGKEMIRILLEKFCALHCPVRPSVSTIGRMIASDPQKMRTFPTKASHFGRLKPQKRRKKAKTKRIQSHPCRSSSCV